MPEYSDETMQIRYDCLVLAIDRTQRYNPQIIKDSTDDEVLILANRFYSFVEKGKTEASSNL